MEKQQESIYFKGAREQQINPETGDIYPWWKRRLKDGQIEFDPNKFDPSCEYKPRGETFRLSSNTDRVFESAFDLDNLRFIDPAKVKEAYEELVEKAHENPEKLLTVLIGTGGTISMLMDDQKNELEPKLDVNQIMKAAGGPCDKFVTSSFSLPKLIDSSQMKIDYIADIAIAMSWIFDQLRTRNEDLLSRFTGYVVTHGTDTAVHSQTNLSFMLGPNCPFNLFFVVAQRTMTDKGSDVGGNMSLALDASETFRERRGIHGICAGGASGYVFNGPTSLKISDKEILLLKDYNQEGVILDESNTGNPTNLNFYDNKDEYMGVNMEWFPIILRGVNVAKELKPREGDDAKDYGSIVRGTKAKFIIIETFGSFTADREIVDEIMKAARETDKLVFATNPLPTGSTSHEYADAKNLGKQGVIPLRMLTHAAFSKLMWAYHVFGDDKQAITKFMTKNVFCNEQLYNDDRAVFSDAKRMFDRSRLKLMEARRKRDDLDKLDLHLKKMWHAEKMQQHYESVTPTYISFADEEHITAMNSPTIRKLIEASRARLFELIKDVLEPHIQTAMTEKHICNDKEIGMFRTAVGDAITRAFDAPLPRPDYKQDSDLGLSPYTSIGKMLTELEGIDKDDASAEVDVANQGYLFAKMLTVIALHNILPELGLKQSETEDDFNDLLSPFKSSITMAGMMIDHNMDRKKYERMEVERTLGDSRINLKDIPRFGMPKLEIVGDD